LPTDAFAQADVTASWVQQEMMMYLTPQFREDRLEVQHALIRAHPLGILVTRTATGLLANAVPFIIDAAASSKGTLRAHVARASAQWREFDADYDTLVVFQGVHSYITPSWYATKQETGKAVPTWNYAIVQARGKMVIHDDPEWLVGQIERLTNSQELKRKKPWAVADAPGEFIRQQIRAIVGIEIPISRIEGKWKVSQNRPPADRDGIIEGLIELGDSNARAMAALIASASGLTLP
jgi:transcriptional regulator